MTDRRKKQLDALFLLIVFTLTIYSVFRGRDLRAIGETLKRADPRYLALGVACVVFFIWGESVVIHYLLRTLTIRTKRRTCFMYSCIGFFFSCVTPSATGGQPAQILYMKKDRIPVPVSTVILMIVTITYKLVLVVIGSFLAIFQREFIHQYLTAVLPIFYLGLALNVFCCSFMLLLVFHPSLAEGIMTRCLTVLVRLRLLKDKPSRMKRLLGSMSHYNATAAYLKRNKKVLSRVMVLTFLQRLALFFITYFVYKAFGLHGTSMYHIVMLQAVISVSVDMLPLPGGMGVSEHLFLTIFIPVFLGGFLLPGMVLSRGIAYYIQLLLSACVTMAAHFLTGRPAIRAVHDGYHADSHELGRNPVYCTKKE